MSICELRPHKVLQNCVQLCGGIGVMSVFNLKNDSGKSHQDPVLNNNKQSYFENYSPFFTIEILA